jgi:NADH-quinone oxidoreductase subunit K
MLTATHVMIFSLLLFGVGVFGVLTRRNILIVLMSLELVLNAANLNFVAFSWANPSINGQVFALFVICVAAGEVAVGLAILITLFRNRNSVNIDEFHIMKG